MNTILENLKRIDNIKITENGAIAYKSTMNKVLDLFSFGGSYRNRTDSDCILLFKEAFEENPELALKCLFYLRDIRGGQGERRFFRVCFKWLIENYPEVVQHNMLNIVEYGRWDDLIYTCIGTKLEKNLIGILQYQLNLDLISPTPSLLAKWMPSCNASAHLTKVTANKIRLEMGYRQKEYRQILSKLRSKIKIVEKLMSQNHWEEIDFAKLPSNAGFKYRNAFLRNEKISNEYIKFIESKNTKIKSNTLYPYEIIKMGTSCEENSNILEKYWNNLPDYFNGKQSNMLCVVDTSGSMNGDPINVAISLGIYAAERAGGPFKNHYISFSSKPQLIEIKGKNFKEKIMNIYKTNLCENTDLIKVFDLLKEATKKADPKDWIENLIVISDMEIDFMSTDRWSEKRTVSEMEIVRKEWENEGLKMPHLVYWNVDARNNTILDMGENVSFVSGLSPSIFTQIISGKTGIDLMLETLNSDRYELIKL